MTNHVHLIAVPTREASLAKALGRTHLMYAQHIHLCHGWVGHLWQSRFYSCPLDEAHAHNATAYVELNPVRAGLVEHAWDYPWSSAPLHCGVDGGSNPLGRVLEAEFVPVAEWKATLEAVAATPEVAEPVRAHTRTGRPLGEAPFLSRIESLLGRCVEAGAVGRPAGARDGAPRKRRSLGTGSLE